MNKGFITVSDILNKIKSAEFISLSCAIIFSVLNSLYSVDLYNTFNFTIFDTGITYHTIYLLIHTHTLLNWPNSVSLLIAPVPFGRLIYIILSPFLFIYDSPVTLLIIESSWISMGSFIIFMIAKRETNSIVWSFGMQIIYILFPATYSILENGAEFEILFPTFVFLSYFLFTREKYAWSVIVALLGAMTSIMSPLFVLFLLVIEDYKVRGYSYRFVRRFLRRMSQETNVMPRSYKYSALAALTGVIAIYLIMVVTTPMNYIIPNFSGAFAGSNSLPTSNFLVSFLQRVSAQPSMKLSYLYEILGGFLFLPLLSPYAVIVVIYIFTIFYINLFVYINPAGHQGNIFYAFLFLGTVYSVRKLKLNKSQFHKLTGLLIISMLVLFLLYSPLSAVNLENGTVHSELVVTPEDKYLSLAFSQIPANSSVFTQNAFTQLMNRVSVYIPGYYNNQTVDYAVVSSLPIPSAVLVGSFLGFSPYWAQHFLNNTSYGVFEFVEGVTVFKLNYHSPPILYIPLTLNYQIDYNLAVGTGLNAPVYRGVYKYIPPGQYKFTYTLKVNDEVFNSSLIRLQEQTWKSNGNTLSSPAVSIASLQERNGYLIYCVIQNLTSYQVEYQPNLIIYEEGGILTFGIDVISLEMESTSIQM